MAEGFDVLLEIDWQGARQIRPPCPIVWPSLSCRPPPRSLERRLRGRSTDSEATIRRRLRDARADMSHWAEFDYAVINEDFDRGAADLRRIFDGGGEQHRTDDVTHAGAIARLMAQTPAFSVEFEDCALETGLQNRETPNQWLVSP